MQSGKPVRFLVVGSSAAALQFLFSWLFLRLGIWPALAALLAFGIAFTFAYCSHRYWTFSTKTGHRVLLPRYMAAQFLCALTAALATEATYSLHWPNVAVAIAATLVSGALAYFLTSRWVFSS